MDAYFYVKLLSLIFDYSTYIHDRNTNYVTILFIKTGFLKIYKWRYSLFYTI